MIAYVPFLRHVSALLAFVVAFAHALVWADQRELKTDASEHVDAVLLLDTSGSMLLNDPARLRDEGARLFVQFLKPGDRLAIVEFAETANVIRPLQEFQPEQSEEVGKLISSLPADGEYTDILGGIRVARDVLDKGADKSRQARPLVVLLSDGRMDPDPLKGKPDDFTHQLLDDVLPEMKAAGQRVYALAFSADTDKELLQQIAAGTDSILWFTPTAEQVHKSYAELFLSVKKPQVIPLGEKGFVIDSDVQEATFYIDREGGEDVRLQSPDGEMLDASSSQPYLKWFRSTNFDVITISSPRVGTWHLHGISTQDGFATILTNLKLVSSWPTSVDAGSEEVLEARLYESQKPIVLPEMSGVVRYAFQITPTDKVSEPVVRDFLVDDGSKGDLIAKDGIFSFKVKLEEPGDYRLRVLARGPTFERQLQIPFKVKPPLITLSIAEGGSHGSSAHGKGHDAHGGEQSGHESDSDSGHGEEHGDQAVQGHGESSHDEGGHGKEHAPHAEDAVVKGNQNSIFQIDLSEEARSLKGLKVELQAVDERKTLYKIPVKKASEHGLRFEADARVLPRDGVFELTATLAAENRQKKSVRAKSHTLAFERTTIGEEQPAVEIVAVTAEEKPQSAGFPIVGVLLVTLVNVLGGVGGAFMLKKAQRALSSPAKGVEPIAADILKAIAELEARATATEVDFESAEYAVEDEEVIAPPADAQAQVASQEAAEESPPSES